MNDLLALDPCALDAVVCHQRARWDHPGCTDVFVHGRLAVLQGTEQGLAMSKRPIKAAYAAAKALNDIGAAFELVDMIYREAIEDRIVDRIVEAGRAPIFVRPYPAFDDEHAIDRDAAAAPGPRNAIPFAYASRLQSAIGGELDATIVQAARVGRTKLKRFQRFLWQPSFVGDVRTDRPYVLVDDAFAIGGTLAALYAYIVSNGGTVAAVTSLVHQGGSCVPFALTPPTSRAMYNSYGESLAHFWKEVIGHETDCLTESEGAFLVQWIGEHHAERSRPERILALRNRLLEARNRGE